MKTRDFDTIRASNKRFFENRGLKGGAEPTELQYPIQIFSSWSQFI